MQTKKTKKKPTKKTEKKIIIGFYGDLIYGFRGFHYKGEEIDKSIKGFVR